MFAAKYTESLLPIDLHARRRQAREHTLARSGRWLIAVTGIGLVLLAALIPLSAALRRSRARLHEQQKTATSTSQKLTDLTSTQSVMTLKVEQWNRFRQSRTQRQGVAFLCRVLRGAAPPGIYLEQATLELNAKPEQLSLHGGSENMQALQAFTRALAASPLLKTALLVQTASAPEIGPSGLTFEIQCAGNGLLLPSQP